MAAFNVQQLWKELRERVKTNWQFRLCYDDLLLNLLTRIEKLESYTAGYRRNPEIVRDSEPTYKTNSLKPIAQADMTGTSFLQKDGSVVTLFDEECQCWCADARNLIPSWEFRQPHPEDTHFLPRDSIAWPMSESSLSEFGPNDMPLG
jgi:hypothetical protein